MSLEEIFKSFDSDKNGSLDTKEFGALLRAFSTDLDEAKVQEVMQKVDADRSGSVDFKEFASMAQQHIGEVPDLSFLTEYLALDQDGNGLLNHEEAQQLAQRLGSRVSVDAMLAADVNKDGCLNYPEFVKLLQQ